MKVETCAFSHFKIYPGHGLRYVRVDSKSFNVINGKSFSYFLQKKKAQRMAWTIVYRKMHKKGTLEESTKRKTRRNVKYQRAIVGASLDVIRAKRNVKPEQRAAARAQALREVKDKKKAAQAQKRANRPAGQKKPVAKNMPKGGKVQGASGRR
eukprot:TRINITY_DN1803_c0_g1_i1.p2 TRINITY_DN1803_c0_g1~~TRINITY_DN1803_c0_g1_i1.p2  ORF type:complete len:153 (-),score=58.22 TRINITY_DN1803_c0_g1_i1:130-588(-)